MRILNNKKKINITPYSPSKKISTKPRNTAPIIPTANVPTAVTTFSVRAQPFGNRSPTMPIIVGHKNAFAKA